MKKGGWPSKGGWAKSEPLSLRLDPKTKFTLEFAARIKGQTFTTVIERAIRESCDPVTIGSRKLNWKSFWDPLEGVRTLKLLTHEDYPSTDDEDDLREFTKTHWAFFYRLDIKDVTPCRPLVEILWPKIGHYRRIWREQRSEDYWAAGKAMAADLVVAKLNPPPWPPQENTHRPNNS